jgi:hypothetical protein
MHDINIRIDQELVVSGNRYNDEITKYNITGELSPKTESEKRLINDVVYLLRKTKLLKDVLELTLKDNENLWNNLLHRQSTIDEALDETVGVK